MAKIHNITGNHLSSNGGGGSGSDGDMDVSKYATITYSDSEDKKVKKYVDDLGVTGKKYVDDQLAAIEIPEANLEDYALVTYSDENDLKLKVYIDAQLAGIPEFPSIDLEGYATEAQLEEVDRTSQMRDEIIDGKIDQESALNTTAHLKMENQIILIDSWSTEGDEKLQAQIDNIADALPESPDNSLSIDIGEQVVKITGSRPTGGAGEDGKVLIWKAQRGGPAEPYNECKMVVPDVDVIDLERDAIWFKQGDKVQQWYMGDPGWITNGNVVHYSALSAFGDNLIDGAPVELWYEDPKKAPAEYFEVITRDESKADDKQLEEKLQAQIDHVVKELEDVKVQLGAIIGPHTGSFVYNFIGNNQWVSTPGDFSTGIENGLVATFLFSTVDSNSTPVDFDSLAAGDILYFDFADDSKVEEAVVHTWVVARVEPQGDVVRVYVSNKAKPPFKADTLYSLQIHDATRVNSSNELSEAGNYDWTGHHKYTGGNVEIDNTYGPVTYHGSKQDYSEDGSHSWMKFRLNANSEHYCHFGPTNEYWEMRWTTSSGTMTWAQTHYSDPAVEISKDGLKVNGSSVTRNATMLQALKSSTDFDSLKAKLVELLEKEVASYEVEEEEAC